MVLVCVSRGGGACTYMCAVGHFRMAQCAGSDFQARVVFGCGVWLRLFHTCAYLCDVGDLRTLKPGQKLWSGDEQ